MTVDETLKAAAERAEIKNIVGSNDNYQEPWRIMGEVFSQIFYAAGKNTQEKPNE
jgi:hypothetical protein